ncbi:MAG: hypothetical protein RBR63_07805 [Methanosarcina vacuolata]|nr:hypothetical protein [Methanosarcina vacuolata]
MSDTGSVPEAGTALRATQLGEVTKTKGQSNSKEKACHSNATR